MLKNDDIKGLRLSGEFLTLGGGELLALFSGHLLSGGNYSKL
jgi:hypothetical protein